MVGGMVLMPLFGAAEGLMLKGQILLLHVRPLGRRAAGENRLHQLTSHSICGTGEVTEEC